MSKKYRVSIHINDNLAVEILSPPTVAEVYDHLDRYRGILLNPEKFKLVFKDGLIANNEGVFNKDIELWVKPPFIPEEAAKKKIFGKSIDEASLRSNKGLPVVLSTCFRALQSESSLKTVGLFRVNGTKKLVDLYKLKFDTADDPVEFPANVDPHIPATLVKIYLDELPDPLVPVGYHSSLLNAVSADSVSKLKNAVTAMPLVQMKIIQFLMRFLLHFLKFSEFNKSNKKNISYVFARILFRVNEPKDEEKFVVVLMKILENYDEIYDVKPSASVKKEVVKQKDDEDDVDGDSDDNEEDSVKPSKKTASTKKSPKKQVNPSSSSSSKVLNSPLTARPSTTNKPTVSLPKRADSDDESDKPVVKQKKSKPNITSRNEYDEDEDEEAEAEEVLKPVNKKSSYDEDDDEDGNPPPSSKKAVQNDDLDDNDEDNDEDMEATPKFNKRQVTKRDKDNINNEHWQKLVEQWKQKYQQEAKDRAVEKQNITLQIDELHLVIDELKRDKEILEDQLSKAKKTIEKQFQAKEQEYLEEIAELKKELKNSKEKLERDVNDVKRKYALKEEALEKKIAGFNKTTISEPKKEQAEASSTIGALTKEESSSSLLQQQQQISFNNSSNKPPKPTTPKPAISPRLVEEIKNPVTVVEQTPKSLETDKSPPSVTLSNNKSQPPPTSAVVHDHDEEEEDDDDDESKFKKKESSRKICAGCGKDIRKGSSFTEVSDDVLYHDDCFTCSRCSQIIDGPYSNKDDILLCKGCYDLSKKEKKQTQKVVNKETVVKGTNKTEHQAITTANTFNIKQTQHLPDDNDSKEDSFRGRATTTATATAVPTITTTLVSNKNSNTGNTTNNSSSSSVTEGPLKVRRVSVGDRNSVVAGTFASSSLGNSTCASCGKEIESGNKLMAIGKAYHKECFHCQKCGAEFQDRKFFNLDGTPVCKACKKK